MMKLGRPRGFTLIELMTSITISSFLGLGIATYISHQEQVAAELEYSINMHNIAKSIEKALSDPKVLWATATYPAAVGYGMGTGTKALRDCLPQSKGGDVSLLCTSTNPKTQHDIELMTPTSGTPSLQAIAKNTIAGTTAKPIWYSLRGVKSTNRSPTPTADAPIRVTAYFWASCAPDNSFIDNPGNSNLLPTVCSKAQTIHVRYQVYHAFNEVKSISTGKKTTIGRQLPAIPSDDLFWADPSNKVQMTTYGAISIDVSQVGSIGENVFACGVNYTLVSIKDSKPICECLYPFFEEPDPSSATGKACIAMKKVCNPDQRFRGLNADGTPICERPFCDQAFQSIADSPNGCLPGGWVSDIQYVTDANSLFNNACESEQCLFDKNGGNCLNPKPQVTCKYQIVCCYETKPPGYVAPVASAGATHPVTPPSAATPPPPGGAVGSPTPPTITAANGPEYACDAVNGTWTNGACQYATGNCTGGLVKNIGGSSCISSAQMAKDSCNAAGATWNTQTGSCDFSALINAQ